MPAPRSPRSSSNAAPGRGDVRIEILFCGVCHSDLHQARDEWSGSLFPMVPGHEIIGRVAEVGSDVTRVAVGEMAASAAWWIRAATASSAARVSSSSVSTP